MDHRALLSKINAPTLLIAGLLDAATPIEAHEFIRSRISGARLAILEAAHLSNIEQSDAYTDTVYNFFGIDMPCTTEYGNQSPTLSNGPSADCDNFPTRG